MYSSEAHYRRTRAVWMARTAVMSVAMLLSFFLYSVGWDLIGVVMFFLLVAIGTFLVIR